MSVAVSHFGTVKDQTGAPLFGVNVYLADTPFPKGTISDFDGNFTINGYENEKWNISHVGKKTVQITLQKGMQNEVYTLNDNATNLDEVVVTAPKKTNTWLGAIALFGALWFASKRIFK